MTYLYVLRDPRTAAIRWVGHTTDPVMRYYHHISEVEGTSRGISERKNDWVVGLLLQRLSPQMDILAVLEHDEALRTESLYRNRIRANGADLLNAETGGGTWPPEKCEIQRQQLLREWETGEKRAAIDAAWTDAKRHNFSEKMKEVLDDPEIRRKISVGVLAALKAKEDARVKPAPPTPEEVAAAEAALAARKEAGNRARSAAIKGRVFSESHRTAMSAAAQERERRKRERPSEERQAEIDALWTPEKRAAHSTKMEVILSDPAIRQTISENLAASYTNGRRGPLERK